MNYEDQGFTLIGKLGTTPKPYNPDGQYEKYDIVFVPEDGCSYVSLVDKPVMPPVEDNENWMVIARNGKDGAGGVTGIKGEAEDDYQTGDYEITKKSIGLEKVENKSIDEIKESLTKEDVGLSKVENKSVKEIIDQARESLDCSDINAVEKAKEPERIKVYAADKETADTLLLDIFTDEQALSDVFDKLTLAGMSEFNEILGSLSDEFLITGPVLKLLLNHYKEWLEIQILKDLHPVIGIKAANDTVYKTGYVEITKESLGITESGAIDDTGCGVPYYAECSSESTAADKELSIDDFILRAGRLLYVKFNNLNSASNITFSVNSGESYPVKIRGYYVDRNTASTFRSNGEYLFRFDGESWNYISGSNDVIDMRYVTFDQTEWSGTEAPFNLFVPLDNITGQEEFDVRFDLTGTTEQKTEFAMCGIDATTTQTSEGILLQALKKPSMDLPALIFIS